jgi:hypothetical protein
MRGRFCATSAVPEAGHPRQHRLTLDPHTARHTRHEKCVTLLADGALHTRIPIARASARPTGRERERAGAHPHGRLLRNELCVLQVRARQIVHGCVLLPAFPRREVGGVGGLRWAGHRGEVRACLVQEVQALQHVPVCDAADAWYRIALVFLAHSGSAHSAGVDPKDEIVVGGRQRAPNNLPSSSTFSVSVSLCLLVAS